MNYCTKCQSIYSQPGTCNCYAPVKTLPYQPFISIPSPWIYPTTVPYGPTWIAPFTITGGTQLGGITNGTISHDNETFDT